MQSFIMTNYIKSRNVKRRKEIKQKRNKTENIEILNLNFH